VAHTDVIVLGAGIVRTSIAVHLAKRGLAVALVDRSGPGEGTSYGNATGISMPGQCRPTAGPAQLPNAVDKRRGPSGSHTASGACGRLLRARERKRVLGFSLYGTVSKARKVRFRDFAERGATWSRPVP
jgi:3-hydroxyacyl-CoA dehydrogenase